VPTPYIPTTGRATGEAEVINGFTVIAEKTDRRGYRTILGHRPAPALTMPAPESKGHEFVIGHNVARDSKSWGSGSYYWDLGDAFADWQEV
jgi:hypothetical protein